MHWKNLIYTTTQNHTMLLVYKGVNVYLFTKTTYVATLINTTKYLGANTNANKSSNIVYRVNKLKDITSLPLKFKNDWEDDNFIQIDAE